MKRKFLTILTVMSLLLLLATAALWVRSAWCGLTVVYAFRNGNVMFDCDPREAAFGFDVDEDNDFGPGLTVRDSEEVSRWPNEVAGFGRMWNRQTRAVKCPQWFLVLVFSIPPICWLLGAPNRHRAKRRLGLCPNCNYDLRATPQRCPECGRAVVAVATIAP
jgi:hypothetical protein